MPIEFLDPTGDQANMPISYRLTIYLCNRHDPAGCGAGKDLIRRPQLVRSHFPKLERDTLCFTKLPNAYTRNSLQNIVIGTDDVPISN